MSQQYATPARPFEIEAQSPRSTWDNHKTFAATEERARKIGALANRRGWHVRITRSDFTDPHILRTRLIWEQQAPKLPAPWPVK